MCVCVGISCLSIADDVLCYVIHGSCSSLSTLSKMSQAFGFTQIETRLATVGTERQFVSAMDSSAELRAKRAGFLARFDISVPKFSKQERSVLEVSYHHQQQKDSFRLDRIDHVRHHIADPVPTTQLQTRPRTTGCS